MVSKEEMSEAFDDLGFNVLEDPLVIDRLCNLSIKYKMSESQLSSKYLAFALTLSKVEPTIENLRQFEQQVLLIESMVEQFYEKENEKESRVQDTKLSVGSELEEPMANGETTETNLSSPKSMAAQFSEKGTENESGVYDTKVSVASDLDTLRSETTIEMSRPSSRKSMVAQFLEKGTDNESDFQDITVSVPSESETTIHAMTPSSSRKSMVSQSLENKAEDQISPDAIETVEEYEARMQGNRD